MENQMKSIKLNRFTSFLQQPDQTQSPESSPTVTDLITLILYHLNQWLTSISNLLSDLTNFLADHWLMIAAGGVLLLCFMCCLPVILRCFAWVLVACFNLIKGFFMMLFNVIKSVLVGCFNLIKGLFMMMFNAIKSVFRCLCCCCARSGKFDPKMMKAPGTGGRLFITRASFENNPAAYFQNLRATPLLSK